jgi:hypothetical protein
VPEAVVLLHPKIGPDTAKAAIRVHVVSMPSQGANGMPSWWHQLADEYEVVLLRGALAAARRENVQVPCVAAEAVGDPDRDLHRRDGESSGSAPSALVDAETRPTWKPPPTPILMEALEDQAVSPLPEPEM